MVKYQNYINNSNKANKNDCDDNLNINKTLFFIINIITNIV